MPKNAIIVGMPRSGTSLAASIFAKQGFFAVEDQQKQLRVADEFNPTGYWEAEALTACNAEVFAEVGYPHDNTWLFAPISSQQADAINQISPKENHRNLIETYNQSAPWVLKDPRFCYTLGYWWSMMDQSNTRVLLVRRDPKQILNSFLRLKWRQNSTSECNDVFQRVEDHLAAAERAIEMFNIPCLSIDYSDYENKPEEIAVLLSDFFEVGLTASDLGYSKKYNNSSMRGRLEIKAQKIADLLPKSYLKNIKRLIPGFIFKRLFPAKTK